MKNLALLLFTALLLLGCKKNKNGDILRANVDGNTWQADQIITNTNDIGEVISIEGQANDGTRMIFNLMNTELDVFPTDFPTDVNGNSIMSQANISIVPDMAQIRYHVELLGVQPYITRFILEKSDDGENFEAIRDIPLEERNSLTESWVGTNQRTSNCDYIFYRFKLIYSNSSWVSNVQIGSTSFRAAYDAVLTQSQSTGDFTLTSYDRSDKTISGEFSFNTSDHEILGGEMVKISF